MHGRLFLASMLTMLARPKIPWSCDLCQEVLAARDFVLQSRGEVVDVCGGDVYGWAFEKWGTVAADGVAADLDQQSLDDVRIELLRRHADQIAERAADGHRGAIGASARHGVERISEADDADRHGHIFLHEFVRVSGAIAALVMPAHGFGNFRPRKLHATDDLVTDRGVIGHLAKFFGIESTGLSEEAAIDGDLADVVQVSGAAQRGDFVGIHSQCFADCCGVTSDAQGMSVNCDVLYIDRGGEGFESVVVEAVQRGHEAQIFRDTLRDGLRESMILNRESHVAAEQVEGVEFAVFIECVSGTASEGDNSSEAASGFERRETLE